MNLQLFILIISTLIIIILLLIFSISYIVHLNMTKPFINNHPIIKNNFKNFKKDFHKKEWRRDLNNKYSFFDPQGDFPNNYIHASIIIIDKVLYRFTLLSYIRFLIFINLNKTTKENVNKNVNTKKRYQKTKIKKTIMIGTKLYCHTPVLMNYKRKVTTPGKYYTTISGRFSGRFSVCIIDDEKEEHYFNIKYLNKYFYTPKDMRKQKILKLQILK